MHDPIAAGRSAAARAVAVEIAVGGLVALGFLALDGRHALAAAIGGAAMAAGNALSIALAFGGGIPSDLKQGWYVEPTLLTNVSNDSTVAQEEIFGPVIVLIPYEDEDDAVRLANDSRFGLSGSVFTGDPVRGFEIARRIRTGTFRVNTMSADFNSSFGGYKESGIGREHGPYAIEEYLLDKTISIEPSEEVPDEVIRSFNAVPAHV